MTQPIYYKQQNEQWSDQYSVHKIIPDTHLLCELHVTVKLHRAGSSLSDADPHFFPNNLRAVCIISVSLTENK